MGTGTESHPITLGTNDTKVLIYLHAYLSKFHKYFAEINFSK